MRCQAVADGLRRRGHQVDVLTGRYRTPGVAEPAANVTRALHLTYGPPYPPEDVAGLLRCETEDRRTLTETLARVQPDVVDVWGMEFASQSLVEALLDSGVPVHLTLEDVWLADGYARDPLCQLTQVARDLVVDVPTTLRSICCLGRTRPHLRHSRVCFVSRALRDYYRRAGFDHRDSHVRMAGIDLAAFRDACPAPPPPPFVILSVGQLTASRGQSDVIRAAVRLAADERCPWPIVLRIVGGGSDTYLAEMKEIASAANSERLRVELTGTLPPERVIDCYAGAHLCVHASRLPEGLPRVLMEAMAAGIPVIATNTGGQRDILADGRWGPLIPPSEPEILARTLRAATTRWDDWRARARAARRHALQAFDIEAYVDGHAEDLAQAVASQPGIRMASPGCEPDPHQTGLFVAALAAAAEIRAQSLAVTADPEAAWQIGVALKRSGQVESGARLLAGLLTTHRADSIHVRRATFHLAEIALVRNDWARARELLRECLLAAPDHTKAAHDLRCAEKRRLPEHLADLAAAMHVRQR
ncbi:MAG: glycosyltransferase [Planctomycetes bacterium]|nr:glycosyltransferase [Planctomycetota bacterium]